MLEVKKVAESERINVLPFYTATKSAGMETAVVFEALTYKALEHVCPEYSGGSWDFYELYADGEPVCFYMAPDSKDTFSISCPNFYQGTLSPDATGIFACLMSLNAMMWRYKESEDILEKFHFLFFALRGYAVEHEEAEKIMSAID